MKTQFICFLCVIDYLPANFSISEMTGTAVLSGLSSTSLTTMSEK